MPQTNTEIKIIGGKQFEMYMLPPMMSHDLLVDTITMVGPSIGPVFDTFFEAIQKKGLEELLDMEVPPEFFTQLSVRLFQDLDKATMRNVMAGFRQVTTVDGTEIDKIFDDLFAGKLDWMYRWAAWGIDVQWGKSLAALLSEAGEKAKAAIVATAKAKASQSQKGSTG